MLSNGILILSRVGRGVRDLETGSGLDDWIH
jgi:hypothetical protein